MPVTFRGAEVVSRFEQTEKGLAEQNARFGKQLEAADQKVQEFAGKTIESAGHAQLLAEL